MLTNMRTTTWNALIRAIGLGQSVSVDRDMIVSTREALREAAGPEIENFFLSGYSFDGEIRADGTIRVKHSEQESVLSFNEGRAERVTLAQRPSTEDALDAWEERI